MKWLARSIPLLPLLALLGISCSSTNNTTVINPLAPTVTGFSPDPVWTLSMLRISGTHFGYDPQNVRVTIDTVPVTIVSVEDTAIIVEVPASAHTGLVHVWSYEQTGTSALPVVVNYTFDPLGFADSVSLGDSFSIPGIGLNNYKNFLHLFLNGLALPVDSIFPNRIVSHAIPGSYSGTVIVADSSGSRTAGSLVITRASTWNTLSEIFDNLTITESHHLTGYRNGPGTNIDSSWTTTVTYSGQTDLKIAGLRAAKTARGLTYTVQSPQKYYYPLFSFGWDTINQTASVSYIKTSTVSTSSFHSVDTQWYGYNTAASASLPVDRDVEFPLKLSYSIAEDSTDPTGLVNWKETTNTSIVSGSFDIILKQ